MARKTQILTHIEIRQKINRIAYEILEDNYDAKEITIIGIKKRGLILAKKLQKVLSSIGDLKIILGELTINKEKPAQEEIQLSLDIKELKHKVVILVDDVANTGQTLTYALKPFLTITPKKIRTAVLIDRKHKLFPVCADYVGMSLSTTIQEHISVNVGQQKEEGAFLS